MRSSSTECQAEKNFYICTLPPGHTGDHEAWGVSSLCLTWPQNETEPEVPVPEPAKPRFGERVVRWVWMVAITLGLVMALTEWALR